MSQPTFDKVYIIVLNWNQPTLTASCVRSLTKLDYPEYRVVVVDNGSQDGSVEKLRAEFKGQIDLLTSPENHGFAGGNNIGIRYALEQKAGYIMLLNNDTIVDRDFLTPLVETLQSDAKIGAVTPKIYFMHNPQTIWAAGGEIRWWLGQVRSRGKNQLDCGQFDDPSPVDYATGCCLLIRRAVLEEIGLLDERYFAYFEDSDWSVRARQNGWHIWYEPTSEVWHVAGASLGDRNLSCKTSSLRLYLTTRNNLWFIRCYTKRVVRLVAIMSFAVRRLLLRSIKQIALGRSGHLKNLWKGARDGWGKHDCNPLY